MSEQQNNNTQKPFLKRISDMEKAISILKTELELIKKEINTIKNVLKNRKG